MIHAALVLTVMQLLFAAPTAAKQHGGRAGTRAGAPSVPPGASLPSLKPHPPIHFACSVAWDQVSSGGRGFEVPRDTAGKPLEEICAFKVVRNRTNHAAWWYSAASKTQVRVSYRCDSGPWYNKTRSWLDADLFITTISTGLGSQDRQKLGCTVSFPPLPANANRPTPSTPPPPAHPTPLKPR